MARMILGLIKEKLWIIFDLINVDGLACLLDYEPQTSQLSLILSEAQAIAPPKIRLQSEKDCPISHQLSHSDVIHR